MILPIVEGHGEAAAVPILIRRVVAHYAQDVYADVEQPIRVSRAGFVQPGGLSGRWNLPASSRKRQMAS